MKKLYTEIFVFAHPFLGFIVLKSRIHTGKKQKTKKRKKNPNQTNMQNIFVHTSITLLSTFEILKKKNPKAKVPELKS